MTSPLLPANLPSVPYSNISTRPFGSTIGLQRPGPVKLEAQVATPQDSLVNFKTSYPAGLLLLQSHDYGDL